MRISVTGGALIVNANRVGFAATRPEWDVSPQNTALIVEISPAVPRPIVIGAGDGLAVIR